jgi:hypothetical protein
MTLDVLGTWSQVPEKVPRLRGKFPCPEQSLRRCAILPHSPQEDEMKKQIAKLTLAKETVRGLELSPDQQGEIHGGRLASYSCNVFECPVVWA